MTAGASPQADQSFMYLETTIPAGLTIDDYRRCRPRRPRRLARARRIVKRSRQ